MSSIDASGGCKAEVYEPASLNSLHIVAGIDARNGGPSYSVPRLCRALRSAGPNAELFTLRELSSNEYDHIRFFQQTAPAVPLLGDLKLSLDLDRALNQAAPSFDVVHVHGLWLAVNAYAGRAAAKAHRPLVVSPRGMLAPEALRFSRQRKQLTWLLYQGPALRKAAAWHATSEQEAQDIQAFGIKAPIAIIPNGIDLPSARALHAREASRRTLLFMSRLHPKKGLPILIEAWRLLAPGRQNWHLAIAGPDEDGHRAELEALVNSRQIPRVEFLGPVYGECKTALLQRADLFVLPTHSENFGIAVAEALAAGVPAIVTKGAPWGALEVNHCGWWIDHGVAPLVEALGEATGMAAQEREAMGLNGVAWMERSFGWTPIAMQMLDVYRWLSKGGARPHGIVVS